MPQDIALENYEFLIYALLDVIQYSIYGDSLYLL